MPKATPLICNFNAGELSPRLDARSDIQKYYSGCRTLENMIPLVEGGAIRAPGTYFVAEVKDSSQATRLVDFHFSTVQAYVIEFGEEYLRFYKDQGQIVVAYAAWANGVAYDLGDLVTQGVGYYRCIVAHTAGVFANDLAAGYWATTGGATDLAYEIPTPYQEADLFTLKFTQSADVLWIFHPDYPTKKLTRTGHTAWTLTNQNYGMSTKMVITNITQANPAVVTCSSVPATITAGGTIWIEGVEGMIQVNDLGFTIANVTTGTNGHFELQGINSGAYTAYASGGTATETIVITGISQANPAVVTTTFLPLQVKDGDIVYIQDVTGMTEVNDLFFDIDTVVTGAGGTFELAGIDSTLYTPYAADGTANLSLFGTDGNNPACGTFFEQRLAVGSSDNNPQTVAMSASSDYDDWLAGTADDDPLSYTIVSTKVDRIRWMAGEDRLVIGTVGGVWRLGATSATEPLTPTNVQAKKSAFMGCADIEAESVGDGAFWVSRSGRNVRQLIYSLEEDRYKPIDFTRLAKHIAKGDTDATSGIVEMSFQQEPVPILWAVRADGQLLGMTYETPEEVYAWFRIKTTGEIESVAVIGADGQEDEVWILVKRTVGTSDVRYIEYFKPHDFYSEIKDAFFVHCGLTYDGGDAYDITDITQANPAVVTAPGHPYTGSEEVRIKDVEGMTQVSLGLKKAYTVANVAGDTFELAGIDSTGWDAYTGGGAVQKVTSSPSGLDHLEGETVSVLIDGAVHPEVDVSSGSIDLDWYGNKIHAGLPYTSIVEPMKLHAGMALGTARGKMQKITKLTVAFYETTGAKAGPDQDHLKPIPFGTGQQPTLFTGDKDFDMVGDWGKEATISIVQDQPLPMTILAIVPRVTLNED